MEFPFAGHLRLVARGFHQLERDQSWAKDRFGATSVMWPR